MAMKPVIRPLPKYSPDYYKPGMNVPHTEILLYEDTSQDKKSNATSTQPSHHTELVNSIIVYIINIAINYCLNLEKNN